MDITIALYAMKENVPSAGRLPNLRQWRINPSCSNPLCMHTLQQAQSTRHSETNNLRSHNVAHVARPAQTIRHEFFQKNWIKLRTRGNENKCTK